jgi:hypothetical protein
MKTFFDLTLFFEAVIKWTETDMQTASKALDIMTVFHLLAGSRSRPRLGLTA